MMMKNTGNFIENLRPEYFSDGIDQGNIPDNPIDLFEKWMDDAISANNSIPNAMHLSTATPGGQPSGRVVLLKCYDQRGFVFFTNYRSRKGNELENNNLASLTFFWSELYRQVRIEGSVSRVSPEESDEYFSTRPRESQVAALVSEQSRVMNSRQKLERAISDAVEEYSGRAIPRPPSWGGYCLSPVLVEFWQGREHRLHDRLLYSVNENGTWRQGWLYP